MKAALKAGSSYFAIVYGIGFVFGTVRVLLLMPRVGEVTAVLLEAPLMLLASWLTSKWSCTTFSVPARFAPRALMGTVALALLLCGELVVSNLVFGRSLESTLTAALSEAGIAGLLAQLVFALMPVAQIMLPSHHKAAF